MNLLYSLFVFNIIELDQYGYTIENFTDTIVRRFIGTLLNDLNVFRHNQTAEELYTRYTWWSNLENNTARWKRTVDVSLCRFIYVHIVDMVVFATQLFFYYVILPLVQVKCPSQYR